MLIKDYFVTVSSIWDKKKWRLLPLSPMYVFILTVKIRIKHSQICEITLNRKQCIKSFFLHSLFCKLSNKSSTCFKVCKFKCAPMIMAFPSRRSIFVISFYSSMNNLCGFKQLGKIRFFYWYAVLPNVSYKSCNRRINSIRLNYR